MTKATEHAEMEIFDCAVVGGGLSGLIAAIGAAAKGLRVALIAPPFKPTDGRTTALLADSFAYLDEIGIGDELRAIAHPLKTMRIIDGTDRLMRAPQTDFRAGEIDLEAFGYNIANAPAAKILEAHIADIDTITRFETIATGVVQNGGKTATVELSDGREISAGTVIAADGRRSAMRAAVGIETREWSYPQTAVVANLSHTLDHHDTSTEFHTETGPTTLVPLGQNQSSIVCVVDPAHADKLLEMDDEALGAFFETRTHSVLGKSKLKSTAKSYPLSSLVARRFGKGRVMLIGEAGHAFPPIGAQGLNLGIRDIRKAIECAQAGDRATAGDRYHTARAADVVSRTASVDMLNRSLLTDLLPVQALRGFGLFTLGSVGPLRRFLMREGVNPGGGFSSLLGALRPRRSERFRSAG